MKNVHRFFSRISSNGRLKIHFPDCHRNLCTISSPISPFLCSISSVIQKPDYLEPFSSFRCRNVHSDVGAKLNELVSDSEDGAEEDGTMNDFLSRFVWIMRGKLSEVYPHCDKKTIDGMLLIVVGKVVSELEKGGLEQVFDAAVCTPSQDFSEDLWRTVWEVSNVVLEDMRKARRKEKMKTFLQSEEVKEMYRFAGEAGIRGDMLRELRFKWAREKMEESEFYESLERLRQEDRAQDEEEKLIADKSENLSQQVAVADDIAAEERPKVLTLPKRHGKIKYNIYGLDLSDPKWVEVADKIHETGEIIWPQEPKPITGKCKLITERIFSLKEDDDPSSLLAEWMELLKPSRIDWVALLDQLNARNTRLYFKVAELLLGEESYQTNISDYSKLIEAYAKENHSEDAERILKKMNANGIVPDVRTYRVMVHMYSKAGNLERAKEACEILTSQGFQPDIRLYNSMIMAYVTAGQPKLGETLLREMETRGMKPTEEIYMALLRSFARCGDLSGVGRTSTTMQFAGFHPSLEYCTLLVEAYAQAGDSDQARNNFDFMLKVGHKPDDRCTACMIAAYEKKNLLDKALNLLLQLEKDGFEPGIATCSVLVDWLGELQLIDEAEQMLGKISEQGETPPFKVQISLCAMYSKAGVEKKALQALGVLESKKDNLGQDEFVRIIRSLIEGGFVKDAQRILELMKAQGFAPSESIMVLLMSSAVPFGLGRQTMR